MKRLARWSGAAVLMLALFYGFGALAGAFWLKPRLTPTVFARDPVCWGRHDKWVDGPERYAARPRARDWLVIRAILPHESHIPSLGWHLRNAALMHVYRTYWSEAERQRLFVSAASYMRPCGRLVS